MSLEDVEALQPWPSPPISRNSASPLRDVPATSGGWPAAGGYWESHYTGHRPAGNEFAEAFVRPDLKAHLELLARPLDTFSMPMLEGS